MDKAVKKIKRPNVWLNGLNRFLSAYFNWLVGFTVATILISGTMIFIMPRYNLINSRIVSVSEGLDQEYEKLFRYANRLAEINRNYNNIRQDNIDKIQRFLPNQPDVEELIEKLELVARGQGLFLSALEVKANEGSSEAAATAGGPLPAGVHPASITMNLGGVSYTAMKSFIATLESSLRLIDITNLNYDPGSESLTIEAVAYYLKS